MSKDKAVVVETDGIAKLPEGPAEVLPEPRQQVAPDHGWRAQHYRTEALRMAGKFFGAAGRPWDYILTQAIEIEKFIGNDEGSELRYLAYRVTLKARRPGQSPEAVLVHARLTLEHLQLKVESSG